MKLICGLGNPGKRYIGTRHNIGFAVIDSICQANAVSFDKRKFPGETAKIFFQGEPVVLLKSTTYMNDSGHAVNAALRYYKLEASDLLVVYDDVDLEFLRMRFRRQGSSGGHRGIESVVTHLHSNEFDRLKLGVGSEYKNDTSDFVLAKFSVKEQEKMSEYVAEAVKAVEDWLKQGPDEAMQKYN